MSAFRLYFYNQKTDKRLAFKFCVPLLKLQGEFDVQVTVHRDKFL